MCAVIQIKCMSKSNWRPLKLSHKLQRSLLARAKRSGWKFMSQMFCMCLRSCALRAILYSKCYNMCALSDAHMSCMQRHINTWELFCPQGRNSAVWELFKPSKWCTFGNKYRCLFLKAAQAMVGWWIQRITQKSLLTANDKSQNTEEESFASQDNPRPCVSAAFLIKMSIYVQSRCKTKCTLIGFSFIKHTVGKPTPGCNYQGRAFDSRSQSCTFLSPTLLPGSKDSESCFI